eukprot:2107443-Rhodomonas_salina.1
MSTWSQKCDHSVKNQWITLPLPVRITSVPAELPHSTLPPSPDSSSPTKRVKQGRRRGGKGGEEKESDEAEKAERGMEGGRAMRVKSCAGSRSQPISVVAATSQ